MCVCMFAGEVYTWGDNDEGQLGDGTTNAIPRPRLVAALQGKLLRDHSNILLLYYWLIFHLITWNVIMMDITAIIK